MKQNNYILKVIPLQPLLPNSPDFFIYFSSKKVKNGSLVEIDFKGKNTIGYVLNSQKLSEVKFLIKRLNYQIKSIKKVLIDKSTLTDYQKKIAFKISRYYYLSLSHSFYLFLKFYKKNKISTLFKKIDIESSFQQTKGKFRVSILKKFNFSLIENNRCLIIFPLKQQADSFYFNFKNKIPNLIYLNLEKINNFEKYLDCLFSNKNYIFLGNKNIIFLPINNLDKIIVFNEGSIFYNEFFKIPKINYLEIIEIYAKLLKCQLIYIDDFLSLRTYLKFRILSYPKINFETFQRIEDLIKISPKEGLKKIFIFQKNIGQKLSCLDCYYNFECEKCRNYLTILEDSLFCNQCLLYKPLITYCPRCNSENLFIKKIGKEFIKKILLNNGFNFLDIAKDQDIKKINKNTKDCFIIGSWQILNIPSEYVFFINFDIAFFSDNLFLKEKYLRLLKHLENYSKKIFVHTSLSKNFIDKIRQGQFIEDIIQERKFNYVPPFCYQVKLISRLSDLEKLNFRLLTLKERLKNKINKESSEIKILGPFLERYLKVKKRYQMYILLKSKKRINLKKLLEDEKYIEEIKFDDYDI
ncbi:MAG: hypothetical protein KatS3mg095_0155 [Candidatus Parcubacteria bacterium]|nr:MAG: hypothetical protein KatS3mg095_0155 [Candidatus Parcubacteria bacterium]